MILIACASLFHLQLSLGCETAARQLQALLNQQYYHYWFLIYVLLAYKGTVIQISKPVLIFPLLSQQIAFPMARTYS